MTNLIFILFVIVLSSCGPHMYSTRSTGLNDEAFIIVLSDNKDYSNVEIEINGIRQEVSKVYRIKDARKAYPIPIATGKQKVIIYNKNKKILEQELFLGLQETRKILLR